MEIDLDKLVPGAKYFRWKEILKCNQWGVHVFPTDTQYLNILKLVKKLDLIREYLDKPMHITSGLRPNKYNKLIGGAKYSAHKLGMAADFYVKGLKADRVREILVPVLNDFEIRMENLPGSNWVHIDIRPCDNTRRYFRP